MIDVLVDKKGEDERQADKLNEPLNLVANQFNLKNNSAAVDSERVYNQLLEDPKGYTNKNVADYEHIGKKKRNLQHHIDANALFLDPRASTIDARKEETKDARKTVILSPN